jgi:hypothetical protein
MQHMPTVTGTTDKPQRDWLPTVAYLLMVALLLFVIGLLVWPSLTVAPARDAAYVNPELRLAEAFRAEQAAVWAEAAGLAVNPELKYAGSFLAVPRPAQDFEHANPEVGLVQRLAAFERSR